MLGIEPLGWMMAPSERLALVGLLAMLRPRRTLELGCAQGVLTGWLSEYSEQVISVDIDAHVLRVAEALPNVVGLHMTTDEATQRFAAEGRRFDLTIIDADHSREGVRRDLEAAIGFSDVIVLHDTYHPPCRDGMTAVLERHDVFADLELVPGGLQTDGLWGGLGVVLPGVPRGAAAFVTPRRSTFPWLRRRWRLDGHAARMRAALGRIRWRIGRDAGAR